MRKKLSLGPKGLLLDVGCRDRKQPNFIGLDRVGHPGVDIIHDLEKFPYPLPADSCHTIKCSHVIEHIKPWLVLDFMNELWRMLVVDGQLAINAPYAGSMGFWADPTHCTHVTEVTWQLFDPDFPLYQQYRPKPWKLEHSAWKPGGNIEAIFRKRNQSLSEVSIDPSWVLAGEALAHRALQKHLELAGLFDFLKDKPLKTVVEIGTARGGVFYALCKLANETATLVSIDLPGGEFGGGYSLEEMEAFKKFARGKQKLGFLRADSHAPETLKELKKLLGGKKIDLLFIDGDHTYEGVKKDWEMYSPLLGPKGITVFHDICFHPTMPTCQVEKFWKEVKAGKKTLEFVEKGSEAWGGLGVILR